MTTRRRKRHSPEQIVKKLRDGEAMLNAPGRTASSSEMPPTAQPYTSPSRSGVTTNPPM